MMSKHFLLIIFLSIYSSSYQQQPNIFQSSIYLTPFGTAFQARNQIELLGILSNIQSLIQCSMQCNQNRQCRTFDYDQSSRICRLFEGEFSTGTIITNSTLSSSRIGAVRYNTTLIAQFYSSYNQTCDQCSTGENRYLQCMNNTCQCPFYTYWNGQKCLNQLYNGSNCSYTSPSCRQDLNLTCSNQTSTCVTSQALAISVCHNYIIQQPPVLYIVDTGPQSVLSADFNKDGYLDLAVTNYHGNSISVLFGIGNGSFLPEMRFDSNGANPYWLVAEDFNKDGNLDLAICIEGANSVNIVLGLINGSFQLPGKTFPSGGSLPSSLTAADINKDNKTDLVVVNTGSNIITVFLGMGNGSFETSGSSYQASSSPTSIANGDFNNDGNIDLAVVSRASNQLLIFFGFGNGSFRSNATSYTTGSFPYAVRTADLNGDFNLDLVVANLNDSTTSIFLGTGMGTFFMPSPALYSTGGSGSMGVDIQDLNGDFKMDIVVSNYYGDNFIVYLGNGDGTFGQNKTYSSNGQQLQGIIAADFNKDGKYDLAVANQNNNNVAILLAQCT